MRWLIRIIYILTLISEQIDLPLRRWLHREGDDFRAKKIPMLDWFRAKCPLDLAEQVWVETRMNWLVKEFGLRSAQNAPVLSVTSDFVPKTWNGAPQEAQKLAEKLCELLPVDARRVTVMVCPDNEMDDAAGTYQEIENGCLIRVKAELMQDITQLISTLSHELAHDVLLGQRRLDPSVADHEWVTDLLPVYFGLGIFHANTVIAESSSNDGQWSYWRIRRSGYLPARIYGYALAIFARLRNEVTPRWQNELRLDAADAFRRGLRYLDRAKDSLFQSPAIIDGGNKKAVSDLQSQMQSEFATYRLSALWELNAQITDASTAVPSVMKLLGDKTPAIRVAAAEALKEFGPAARDATRMLLERLADPVPAVRVESAYALAAIRAEPELVAGELIAALRQQDRAVVRAAAVSLQAFRDDARFPLRPLIEALAKANRSCEFETMDALAFCLSDVADFEGQVRQLFPTWDEEEFASLVDLVREATQE